MMGLESEYANCKTLYVLPPAGYDTQESNVPVMVRIGRSAGRYRDDTSDVFEKLGASYQKMAVSLDDGVTECPVEVTEWDVRRQLGILFVKIPSVPTTGMTLKLWYDPTHADNTNVGGIGSAVGQSVWANGFEGVWHMKPGVGAELPWAHMSQWACMIQITYSATDQVTYQQDIVVHRTTGTAYEEAVGPLRIWHIYVGTKCKTDYGDIRFTNSTGTKLAYYLWPDYSSESARFTVRLEGADSAGALMVWYGNPTATTTSDGDTTFPLFDDFTGSSIDTTKWITHIGTDGSPSITVANGEATFTSGSTGSGARYVAIESKQLFGSGYQMVGKLRSSATGNRPQRYTIIGFGATYDNTGASQLGDLVAAPGGAYWRDAESATACWGTVHSGAQGSGTYTKRSEELVSTSYQIFSSGMRSDGIDWDIDGTTYSYDSNPITGEIPVVVGIDAQRTISGDQTTDIVDWVLVRAYSATPPAATAFGPERVIIKQIRDSTSNQNHGMIYGTTEVDGPLGRCLSFDGVDDYINIPYDASLQVTSQMTLTVMLNHSGAHSGSYGGLWHDNRTGTTNRVLLQNAGRILSEIVIGGVEGDMESVEGISADVWGTIDVSYDGAAYIHWIDGVADAPHSVSGDIDSPTGKSRWIGRGFATTYWYKGEIAFVSLSSVARSPAWIALTHASLKDELIAFSTPGTESLTGNERMRLKPDGTLIANEFVEV